jgi:beta-lactamase regulating signal transducer with metallopeptidase domain/ketosteroid isomerase-like protein
MTSLIPTMNEWGRIFCHHAFWMLIQAGVLVAVLWVADRLLRRHLKASIRYAIWLLVLIKLVLPVNFRLPSGIGYWIQWPTPNDSATVQEIPMERAAAFVENAGSVVSESQEAAQPPAISNETLLAVSAIVRPEMTTEASVLTLSVRGWILAVWMAGISGLFAVLCIQWMLLKRMIGRSRNVPADVAQSFSRCKSALSITDTIRICQSDDVSGPAVCGLLRPTILIPSSLINRLEHDQLETVLLHELIHIQRHDLWVNMIQTLLQLFYFYNPFVRLANHFIRKTREQANDEHVLVQLNGRRDHYSAALVEVAAAVVGRPAFAVRLIGVAESKKQLHERITLMMRKSIPTNAKIGFKGTLVLVLLGLALLPMAGGMKAASAVRADTPPISLEQFLAAGKTTTHQILRGNQLADPTMAAAAYTEDAVILPPRHLPALGKSAVTDLYNEGIMKGERILTADVLYEDIRSSGRYLFTVDRASLTVRVPGIEHLLLVHCKTLTVWEIQPDGTLKIKVDAWNFDQIPSAETLLTGTGIAAGNEAFHASADSHKAADASQETLEKVKQISKEFHTACLKGDAALTTSYYADDAFYLADKTGLIHGREHIKANITSFNRQFQLESIGDRIVFAEGTEEMVYVVNQFEWRFRDITQGDQVFTYPGKGVHVWQKQPDGSWKILVDVNSANIE